jgi:uncharacterized RDD family membrane protein YckC
VIDDGRAVYAGLVSRLVAYVLDTLIIVVFTSAGAAMLGLVASVAGIGTSELIHAVFTTYAVCLPLIFAVYCALFWLLAGRTPGMAALGLRVVTVKGRPVGWLAAVVRALMLAYFPIGALWLLVDRRHQSLQDKVARTTVVRATPVQLVRA